VARMADLEKLEETSIDDAIRQLEVDPADGLSAGKVSRRLDKYGANAIAARKEPWYTRPLKNFRGPIPWMLEIAAALAAVRGFHDEGRWEDFAVIFAMLPVR
jgi:H+-transporting ATPase